MSEHAHNPKGHGAETPDPSAGTTLWVGLIGTVLLLAIVLFAQYLYLHAQRLEDEDKLYARQPREILDLRARQSETLFQPRWLDEEAGRVRIPITQAMAAYAKEVKDDPGPRLPPKIETSVGPEGAGAALKAPETQPSDTE
ncbi:MAG: hypothetical protein IPM18_09890 [Phycisphaerales bacterium]|nr:hypothetical protein [Phycisphaerales bacterium]